MDRRVRAGVAILGLALLASSGCSSGVETSYGRMRGASINGTGTLAELFREEGHEVRTAIRLTEELDDWADVIVRFSPRPGPPPIDEADWYDGWLNHADSRRLIYIPRDYDAQAEYWSSVLERLPAKAPDDQGGRARKLRDEAKMWPGRLPAHAEKPAPREDWFAVKAPIPDAATVCSTLGGPWAEGIDPALAALTRHQTLEVASETVLLTGDDQPLAIGWSRFNDSRVLIVASGTFLLNATLVNPARRPLAERVVEWAGESPANVAFVEGASVLGRPEGPPTVFKLLRVPPFGWVAAQMMALGLAACLARAHRLGRARTEPSAGEDRPVAHPEALGTLLARAGQPDQARAILDAYRQWRRKSSGGGPPASGNPPEE